MTRSKRMQSVVEITANREREAARRLGDLQQRLQAAEQRLDELIRYREEYTQQFANGGSLTTARLQDYRSFLGRLNLAVDQQRAVVERTQQDCAAQRECWLEIRGRVQALDKVVSRYRSAERSDHERREQKEADQHVNNVQERNRDDD